MENLIKNLIPCFVISPLRGAIEKNQAHAKKLCHALMAQGYAPFAPHLFYTQFLSDEIEEERWLGISGGLAWLARSKIAFVDGSTPLGITTGMSAEIKKSDEFGVPTMLHMPTKGLIVPAWRSLTY